MARRLIAATLSLSLGLSGLAPAPALAQNDENMGRLIGGLVALGVIGAVAHKDREEERKKEEKRAEKARKEARKEAKKAAKEAREDREDRREAVRDRLEAKLERARDGDGDARTRAALGALSAVIAGQGAQGGIEALAREFGLDLTDPQAKARAEAEARAQAEAQAQAEARAKAEAKAQAQAEEARRAEIVRQAEESRLAEIAGEAEARRRAEARARLEAQGGPLAPEALPPVPREEVTADLLRDWEPAAPRQPETTTPVATGEIPFACLRRQQAGFESASVVDGDCLDDYPVLARSFPLDCAVTGQNEGRITSGYDTQCLRERGYRVAVR